MYMLTTYLFWISGLFYYHGLRIEYQNDKREEKKKWTYMITKMLRKGYVLYFTLLHKLFFEMDTS